MRVWGDETAQFKQFNVLMPIMLKLLLFNDSKDFYSTNANDTRSPRLLTFLVSSFSKNVSNSNGK